MKLLSRLTLCVIAAAALTCCTSSEKPKNGDSENLSFSPSANAIYHWKSTFNLSDGEIRHLKKQRIGRIYIKMFDVAIEHDFLNNTHEINPIATTKFISQTPSELEVVPVVYITIDALRAMKDKEAEYAELIVERALAMCRHNNCGTIKELQLDCDWTSTTKESYDTLCGIAKSILQGYQMELSVTVRLHQLQESAPPAARGVLMLYNTGALKNPHTKNSILDIADVKPYLKAVTYPIPLDYAYPAFGWGIEFKGNEFVRIVSNENATAAKNGYIRKERASAKEVLVVKSLVERTLGKPANRNILYHLDETQLKHYTDYEIAQIFAN